MGSDFRPRSCFFEGEIQNSERPAGVKTTRMDTLILALAIRQHEKYGEHELMQLAEITIRNAEVLPALTKTGVDG